MRQELEELKRLFATEIEVHSNVVGLDMDRLSPTVPSTGIIVVESTDSAEGIGGVVGDLPKQSVLGEGVRVLIMELCVQDFQGGRC